MTRRLITILLIAVSIGGLCLPGRAYAATVPDRDFSLEVSPSPLVIDVSPGQQKTVDLKVRNASTTAEQLKIETRGFSIAHPSEQINITTNTPADLAQWVHYSHPTFSVAAGEWFTQRIAINLPESAGFSYPFVVVISRQSNPAQPDGGAAIRASIAVFALVNIDKPGASRKLEIDSFKLDRNFYEYLPATFNITLKNTGNSIVQPYGNLYIQNSGNESQPLAVLPVNQTGSYILPGSSKTTTSEWTDGFPFYKTVKNREGTEEKQLQLNWDDLAHFRFGHYTAKLVAVYNDGSRDVPIVREVSFWIIPWRILLGVLVILIIIGFGLWSMFKKVTHHTKRIIRRKPRNE